MTILSVEARDNLAWAIDHGGVKIIEGDIRDSFLVNRWVQGVGYIFHQAALRITRCAEAPREAIEVLIDGTFNILEAAIEHNVQKVMAASSASVYGEPSYLPIDESHPFNNRTLYGAGKIACEQMLRALTDTSGLRYIALRPFNVYGPRMDIAGVYTEVLIRWLDAIETNTAPLIFGDGNQSMDFVYVADVARAYLLAAESDVTDDVFNVGTGIQTSLNALRDLLLKLSGSSLRPEHREARAVANVQRRRAAVEKAARMPGFESTASVEQGRRSCCAGSILSGLMQWGWCRHECDIANAKRSSGTAFDRCGRRERAADCSAQRVGQPGAESCGV